MNYLLTAVPGIPANDVSATLQRVYRRINNAYLHLRAQYIAAQTRRALSQLTARELDDIGLTHADIDRVARKVAGA